MNGGKSRKRRQCLHRAIIGYDRLWLDVIGSCDKFSIFVRALVMTRNVKAKWNIKWHENMMTVSVFSEHSAWWNERCGCESWQGLWQGFYDDDPKISWLLKKQHQFTNKKRCLFTSVYNAPCWPRLLTLTSPTNMWLQKITKDNCLKTAPVAQMVKYMLEVLFDMIDLGSNSRFAELFPPTFSNQISRRKGVYFQ